MGEFFERWWPSIVGTLLLAVMGFFLWPRSSAPSIGAEPEPVAAPAALGTESSQVGTPSASDLDRERDLKEARFRTESKAEEALRDAAPEASAPPDAPPAPDDEPARAVTLTQDSPEVRRALSAVEVELYETAWCQYCRKTRAYLDRSRIRYRAYDIEVDKAAKLRRDQMPGRGVPLVVVDGQTINGFSEEALNAAFQSAIQRRLSVR